jgi:hypothetical protein
LKAGKKTLKKRKEKASFEKKSGKNEKKAKK